jgi:tRNA pseudouridine55 synthase
MQAKEGPRSTNLAESTGILVLNKPAGITSRQLVNQVARQIPHSKVGHAGTLDPLASGILIVCVGPATRLVENLQQLPKSYRTVIRLGARSDTLDADGRIAVEPDARVPLLSDLERILPSLCGEVVQQPPAFSALKIRGQRAYDLARAGRTPDLAPRLVRIDSIALLSYDWPRLELAIDCGSGTYIRSIARDLGEMLGCGAYVEALVRTRTGPFDLEQAVDPEVLSTESMTRYLRPALDAVADLPRLVLSVSQVEAVAQGRRLSTRDLGAPPVATGLFALLDSEGALIALGEIDAEIGRLQPRKVLI